MVADDIANKHGFKVSINDQLRSVAAVPSSLDYRTSGKVSSIKDQGLCGCCWSFTSVGLYESFMMYKG